MDLQEGQELSLEIPMRGLQKTLRGSNIVSAQETGSALHGVGGESLRPQERMLALVMASYPAPTSQAKMM